MSVVGAKAVPLRASVIAGSALAAPALLPGLLALAVGIAWQVADGGYAATSWYPGALFVLALLAVVTATYRGLLTGVSLTLGLALASFTAFTAWNFLSIGWADVQGDAWDGANRTLLYLTVFALFALLPWRAGAAAGLLGAYCIATAVVGGVFLLRAAGADDPTDAFVTSRFADPIGYPNGSSSLFLAAFWPALVLASRREVPWPARGVLLGAAGLLLQLGLLPQSRASLAAAPVVLALMLILGPGRLRTIVFLLPVAAVTLATSSTLLRVDLFDGEDVGAALLDARTAMLISVLALVAVGCVLASADRRLRISPPLGRRLSRVGAAATALVALAAVVILVPRVGDPVGRVDAAWEQFLGPPVIDEQVTSHFASGLGGGNRYDIWRVALRQFRERPLTGIGSDNFAADYVRERSYRDEPQYPHSLPVRIVAQTGVVGSLLFAGTLVLALVAAWRALRRAQSFARAVSVAALLLFALWLAHGSVDWFWELPALGLPAFACLGLAAGLGRAGADAPPAAPRRRSLRATVGAVAAAVALTAGASYVLPWLAARHVQTAAEIWRSDPEAAFAELERARDLNPLSDRADLIFGAIGSRLGDRVRMRQGFTRALDRNPHNWYAQLELGVLEAVEGNRGAALRRLQRSRALNPREQVTRDVEESVRARERITLAQVDQAFLDRLEATSSPRPDTSRRDLG